jgi:hypothetical protein
MTEAATVEAGATVVVIAATQPAPAIRAITATWVVLARARMAVTSAVAPKGAVTLVTKEAMAAAAVTMVAGTAVERSRRSEKLLNSGAFGPRYASFSRIFTRGATQPSMLSSSSLPGEDAFAL